MKILVIKSDLRAPYVHSLKENRMNVKDTNYKLEVLVKNNIRQTI